jgi:hypothetical protein
MLVYIEFASAVNILSLRGLILSVFSVLTRSKELVMYDGIIIMILRLTERKQQEIGRKLRTNYRRKIDWWRAS